MTAATHRNRPRLISVFAAIAGSKVTWRVLIVLGIGINLVGLLILLARLFSPDGWVGLWASIKTILLGTSLYLTGHCLLRLKAGHWSNGILRFGERFAKPLGMLVAIYVFISMPISCCCQIYEEAKAEANQAILEADREFRAGHVDSAIAIYEQRFDWLDSQKRQEVCERVIHNLVQRGGTNRARQWVRLAIENHCSFHSDDDRVGQLFVSVAEDIAEEERLQRQREYRAQVEATETTKWYEGGTLHKKSALEWQVASHADKLATCADFVTTMWQNGDLKPSVANNLSTVDDVRPYAQELVSFLDAALPPDPDPEQNRKLFTKQTVSSTAAIGMVTMKWTR